MISDAQSGQNTSVFVPELLKNTRNRRHTHTIQQTKKHTHARTQVNQQNKVCLFQESRQMGEEECHSGRSRRATAMEDDKIPNVELIVRSYPVHHHHLPCSKLLQNPPNSLKIENSDRKREHA